MTPQPPPAADFTSDGIPDLISADGYRVLVRPGRSDGAFDPPIATFVTGASYLTVADFNGDSRLDVVTAGNGGGASDYADTLFSSLLLGRGDGTFNVFESSEDCCFTALAIGTGDTDSDSRADVAIFGFGLDGEQVVFVGLNDGDWRPHVSIGGGTVKEGNTGAANAVFGVYLDFPSDADVTVHFDTENGSAIAGSDYVSASGALTIPAGQSGATFSVGITGDRVPEPSETFLVRLSDVTNARVGNSTSVVTIVDDEPRVSISDVTKAEGKNRKTTVFTFTVTLSAAYDQPVTLSYQTVNGTATTGNNDYVAKSGTITFAAGETTKAITIEVKGDRNKEANEVFYLDLFGLSSNALFTKNRGIGTILNDD
jgi:hypothetical protein